MCILLSVRCHLRSGKHQLASTAFVDWHGTVSCRLNVWCSVTEQCISPEDRSGYFHLMLGYASQISHLFSVCLLVKELVVSIPAFFFGCQTDVGVQGTQQQRMAGLAMVHVPHPCTLKHGNGWSDALKWYVQILSHVRLDSNRIFCDRGQFILHVCSLVLRSWSPFLTLCQC